MWKEKNYLLLNFQCDPGLCNIIIQYSWFYRVNHMNGPSRIFNQKMKNEYHIVITTLVYCQ